MFRFSQLNLGDIYERTQITLVYVTVRTAAVIFGGGKPIPRLKVNGISRRSCYSRSIRSRSFCLSSSFVFAMKLWFMWPRP